MKPDGQILWDENNSEFVEAANKRPDEHSGRPEIDRVVLRDILLDSLKPDTVQWGRKLTSIEPDSASKGNKYNLHFTDNMSATGFDLVVGSDGAWSKVRPLVTESIPFYSGISCIELWKLNINETNPWLSNYVGKGSNFMFDEGRALLCQRNGNGSVRAYACIRVPEDWIQSCGIDWTSPSTARQAVVDNYFSDCADDIKRAILDSHDELIPRALYMLPVGLTWDSHPNITLMGDSAHLMTPFAGVGVNTAMADALSLAKSLISKKDSFLAKIYSDKHNISIAIKEYEIEMFERSKKAAMKTEQGLKGHFAKDGAELMLKRLLGHPGLDESAKKAATRKA